MTIGIQGEWGSGKTSLLNCFESEVAAGEDFLRAEVPRRLRTEAEVRGFTWNYWEFFSSFGVYDLDNKAWREGLRGALLGD